MVIVVPDMLLTRQRLIVYVPYDTISIFVGLPYEAIELLGAVNPVVVSVQPEALDGKVVDKVAPLARVA
jgi:hypothetical protein